MSEPEGGKRPKPSPSARRRPVVTTRRAAPLVPGAPPVRPAASTTPIRRFDGARQPMPRKHERGAAVPVEPAPGTTPQPIVAQGLTKHYGELVAVDHLDLEIVPGEIFGLLGQNGAGKTTTILMLLGLTEPDGGWARVAGYDPERRPLEVKRRVGYLPDAVGFYGTLTGRQNLRYTAKLNGLAGPGTESRIEEVLEQVGMADRADTRADTYSRGMLQRLGIADALVKDPQILILDEPTAAIDPIGVVEILELLRRLAEERAISILLSSHLLTQVQSTCDRVGIFASGRLIGLGTVPELAHRFGDEDARIEVSIDAPATTEAQDRIARTLGSVSGVKRVAPPDRRGEPWTLFAPPEQAADARVATLAAAARDGLRLTSIREIEASLDEIYRQALHATGLADQPRVAA